MRYTYQDQTLLAKGQSVFNWTGDENFHLPPHQQLNILLHQVRPLGMPALACLLTPAVTARLHAAAAYLQSWRRRTCQAPGHWS